MNALKIDNLGKMYKLYDNPGDRIRDAFGINKLLFWKKNYYQQFWALRGFDLVVKKGERLGIIGRNGAGKSTLLKIVAGNLAATEGTVKVNGQIQALMELGTGFHPEFTGRENIAASLAYHGFSNRQIKKVEEDIIEFTELDDFIDQPIKVYSSGMYSRLAFAVATVLRPEVLIIDEILGAGDAGFITKCSLRMKELTEDSGATVLFVSHSMESVLQICNRAILIDKGHLIADADPLSVSKIYNDMIRKEDELLMRARESRLRKRDYNILSNLSDKYYPLLFRIKCNRLHPEKRHLFYGFSIIGNGEVLAELRPGEPMDNDNKSLSRIIDGKSTMDWSNPFRVDGRFCRAYQNEEGSYCHAPFQLCIPVHTRFDKELKLIIEGRTDEDETISIDLWDETKSEYRTVVTLTGLSGVLEAELFPNETETQAVMIDPMNVPNQKPFDAEKEYTHSLNTTEATCKEYTLAGFESELSVYGSREIVISKVDVQDHGQTSRRVFVLGEQLSFLIYLSATEIIPHFFIVASILTMDGRPAGQVFCDSRNLGLAEFIGEAVLSLTYSPLRFGQGEYMVSLGLFKECDMSTERENEAYCVVDRAIFFKIVQPDGLNKGLGAFAHSCCWQYKDKVFQYDPAIERVI